jgi:hypothetical protein
MEGVIVASLGIASNMRKNRMLVRVNSATWISLRAATIHQITSFPPGTFSDEKNVLEYRSGYSVQCDTGAGMVLFSRTAAEIIMDLYSNPSSLQMTTHSWRKFYADLFGLDLRTFSPFWAYPPDRAVPCTLDWGYTPSLYLNGYASLGTIPSYATDLEFDVETFFHTRYVTAEKNNGGVAYPRVRPVAHASACGGSSLQGPNPAG